MCISHCFLAVAFLCLYVWPKNCLKSLGPPLRTMSAKAPVIHKRNIPVSKPQTFIFVFIVVYNISRQYITHNIYCCNFSTQKIRLNKMLHQGGSAAVNN